MDIRANLSFGLCALCSCTMSIISAIFAAALINQSGTLAHISVVACVISIGIGIVLLLRFTAEISYQDSNIAPDIWETQTRAEAFSQLLTFTIGITLAMLRELTLH